MKSTPFIFHKTQMIIRLTTEEAGGQYGVIEMHHPPNVGPALHLHPRGPESFIVLEGSYTFHLDGEDRQVAVGEALCVPQAKPHRYRVGPGGGRLLVICPPGLERYFWEVSQRLSKGPLELTEEFVIAARYGQDFLEASGHWGI